MSMPSILTNNLAPTFLIGVGGIIAFLGGLLATWQQTQTETELRKRSDEIARLNQEISQTLTGGGSFCIAGFARYDDTNDTLALMLYNKGEFSVRNVRVRVLDDRPFQPTDQGVEKYLSGIKKYKFDIVLPGVGEYLDDKFLMPTMDDKINYMVDIYTLNGQYTQDLLCRKVNGKWIFASRVVQIFPDAPNKTVFEEVDKDYPLGEQGKVVWHYKSLAP